MFINNLIELLTARSRLSRDEVSRLQSAARSAGMPWLPIAERPQAARRFVRRVEASGGRD